MGWLIGNDEYHDLWYASPMNHDLRNYVMQEAINDAELLIGFNLKFDLHWLRREGLEFSNKRVWDVQLAFFMLTAQKHPYPSLNFVSEYYGLGQKIDIIEQEYWSKRIDTNLIPADILLNYQKQDVNLTYQCYLVQVEEFKKNPKLYNLFQLCCMDLLVLEEMEWNGLKLDKELCTKRTEEIKNKITELETKLTKWFPDVPINWNSGDHLSAILYGGSIKETIKVPDGFYKTGAKAGQPKLKNQEKVHEFPGFFKPIEGSEYAKGGVWSTDESILRSLRGNKAGMAIIENLLELSKVTKLLDYYEGWPNLSNEYDWEDGEIHGNLNQCVVATGRLSSSKPNQQNVAGECQDIIITRY